MGRIVGQAHDFIGVRLQVIQLHGIVPDVLLHRPLADQRLATRVYVNFAKAIAAYEMTLVSQNSPFDQWAEAGFPTTGPLSLSAQRGAQLFVGKAACAECHAGPLFTDNKFHAIGVPQIGQYVPLTSECPAGAFCDCVSNDFNLPGVPIRIHFRATDNPFASKAKKKR